MTTVPDQAAALLRRLAPSTPEAALLHARASSPLDLARALPAACAVACPPRDPWLAAAASLLTPALATPQLFRARVVCAGDFRPHYAPLLFLGVLQTAPRSSPPALLRTRLDELAADTTALPPGLALWRALLLDHAADSFPDAPHFRTLSHAAIAGAFAVQSAAGHLHPLTPETSLDAFVYDELAGLHAAGLLLRRGAPVPAPGFEALVRYHVENTQPDNTTHEPWGMPAFLRLPFAAAMADQQLHDLHARLNARGTSAGTPAVLLLLSHAATIS